MECGVLGEQIHDLTEQRAGIRREIFNEFLFREDVIFVRGRGSPVLSESAPAFGMKDNHKFHKPTTVHSSKLTALTGAVETPACQREDHNASQIPEARLEFHLSITSILCNLTFLCFARVFSLVP